MAELVEWTTPCVQLADSILCNCAECRLIRAINVEFYLAGSNIPKLVARSCNRCLVLFLQQAYTKIFAQGQFLKTAVLSRFCFCAPRFGCSKRKSDRPKTEVFIFGRFSCENFRIPSSAYSFAIFDFRFSGFRGFLAVFQQFRDN